MLYRHSRLSFAGSLHFVTTVTFVQGDWFVKDAVCRTVLEVLEYYRAKFKVRCFAYVLMPDHLHALLQQDAESADVARLMENFKRLVTKKVLGIVNGRWRSPYDDVPVPGRDAALVKINYIHTNPIRKGLVEKPDDYVWSSARDYAGNPGGIVTVDTHI